MAKRFAALKRKAVELSCNDFDGCLGHCLPVGMEIRSHVHQSSPDHLSIFEVERFIGNFRRDRHHRGTLAWSFANYDLATGKPLALSDIFPKPLQAAPKFWAAVEAALAASGNCPAKEMLLFGRRVSGRDLRATDLILTRGGATIALTPPKSGTCRPQAVDLDVETMIAVGASPALWGR
jgi:hypothetical protein